jgi:hypothetical protein
VQVFGFARSIKGAKRVAINAFLIFHILSVTCWSLPFSSPVLIAYRNFIRPYFVWSGLFQSWDPFAPSPKAINSYVEAIVIYRDGNTRIWPFPRMEQLSLNERYSKERYRKFAENLKEDANAAIWPDAARFIARLNANGPIPVKMVLLVRYWSFIVPRIDGEYVPAPWDEHVFYSYTVQPEDLQ